MEPRFNLIDEAWVCVMGEDGTMEQLSLWDVLLNAQHYRALAGETPTQDVAMLRLLLAVLYAALFGDEQPKTPDDALDAWENLWKAGCFPEDMIQRYLKRWHERFWLFHEQFPFMQVPVGQDGITMENAWEKSGLYKTKGKPASGIQTASKLNGSIMESGNKEKLFNHSTGEEKASLSLPAAARWLVHVVNFDDGGIKPYYPKNTAMNRTDERAKCTVAWLGSISPIYAEGKNLFETLLLNLVLLKDGSTDPENVWDPPHPVWERESLSLVESEGVPVPNDPAALYTMPFRRILLVRRDERVLGFLRYVGEGFNRETAQAEQMTLWTLPKPKKGEIAVPKPRTARMPAQMWRELTAITSGEASTGPRPGVVQWISLLVHSKILPWDRCTFHYVKALYDVAQSSNITEVIEDRVSFSAGLLAEAGRPWNALLSRELSLYEKAAWQLGLLARDLLDAEGGKVSEGKSKLTPTAAAVSGEAQEMLYYSLDAPFRKWLVTIRAEDDSEERQERIGALRKTVLATVLRCGQELINQVSPAAFGKRCAGDKTPHRTAPEAWGIFRSAIYKLLHEG